MKETGEKAFLRRGIRVSGASLEVQWLRHHVSTAGAMYSIPGQGTKIPYAALWQKKRKKILIHTNRSFYRIMSKIISSIYRKRKKKRGFRGASYLPGWAGGERWTWAPWG